MKIDSQALLQSYQNIIYGLEICTLSVLGGSHEIPMPPYKSPKSIPTQNMNPSFKAVSTRKWECHFKNQISNHLLSIFNWWYPGGAPHTAPPLLRENSVSSSIHHQHLVPGLEILYPQSVSCQVFLFYSGRSFYSLKNHLPCAPFLCVLIPPH